MLDRFLYLFLYLLFYHLLSNIRQKKTILRVEREMQDHALSPHHFTHVKLQPCFKQTLISLHNLCLTHASRDRLTI